MRLKSNCKYNSKEYLLTNNLKNKGKELHFILFIFDNFHFISMKFRNLTVQFFFTPSNIFIYIVVVLFLIVWTIFQHTCKQLESADVVTPQMITHHKTSLKPTPLFSLSFFFFSSSFSFSCLKHFSLASNPSTPQHQNQILHPFVFLFTSRTSSMKSSKSSKPTHNGQIPWKPVSSMKKPALRRLPITCLIKYTTYN